MSILGIVQPDGTIKRIYKPFTLIQANDTIDLSKLSTKVYVIDGGDLFEGTLKQFEEAFSITNATDQFILEWCNKRGSTLRIVFI